MRQTEADVHCPDQQRGAGRSLEYVSLRLSPRGSLEGGTRGDSGPSGQNTGAADTREGLKAEAARAEAARIQSVVGAGYAGIATRLTR